MAAFPGAVSDVSRTLRVELPEPRLQTDPPEDLAQFRTEEKKQLDSYYWIDKRRASSTSLSSEAMKNSPSRGSTAFREVEP